MKASLRQNSILVLMCLTLSMRAQNDVIPLYVGQSKVIEKVGIDINNIKWVKWTSLSDNISCSGSGFQATVMPTNFFTGYGYVKCEWLFNYGFTGSQTYSISCIDNPVTVSPTSMTLQLNGNNIQQLNYSHANETYSSYAIISYDCIPVGVVEVSNTGKVKAKNVGTTKVYVHSNLANDENAPYCTVTVTGSTSVIPGDVNNDGAVNIADVTALIDMLLHGTSYYNAAADMNQDGSVNIADVTALIDYLLNGGGKKGDVNNDGQVNIADVTSLIDYLLTGTTSINKHNADVNSDGQINIADVTALIDYLLTGNTTNKKLNVKIDRNEQIDSSGFEALISILNKNSVNDTLNID